MEQRYKDHLSRYDNYEIVRDEEKFHVNYGVYGQRPYALSGNVLVLKDGRYFVLLRRWVRGGKSAELFVELGVQPSGLEQLEALYEEEEFSKHSVWSQKPHGWSSAGEDCTIHYKNRHRPEGFFEVTIDSNYLGFNYGMDEGPSPARDRKERVYDLLESIRDFLKSLAKETELVTLMERRFKYVEFREEP